MSIDDSRRVVILEKIIETKRAEVRRLVAAESLISISRRASREKPTRDFATALMTADKQRRFPVIAEIKQKSPSAGVLRAPFVPAQIAKQYQQGGAACLSVLTDTEYFGGHIEHLTAARAACDLPVLRKDFMIDEWQIYESRAIGADAVLLLASVLSAAQMQGMAMIAVDLGMTVLFEVHTQSEAESVLGVTENATIKNKAIIGINNRDLTSFEVSLNTTINLLPRIKKAGHFVVSESGIKTPADIDKLLSAGTQGFLIGSILMKAENPGAPLGAMFGQK